MNDFKFPLGQIVMTRAVSELCAKNSEFYGQMCASLLAHAHGIWGDVCAEDKLANESALIHGGRLFSSYIDGTLWIISEADRSVTTILFPEDY